MEEWKHVCKFCRKSFPCGRSLGGHMRSHVSSAANTTSSSSPAATASASGYDLREKRNKTWRLVMADSTEEEEDASNNNNNNKFCKQCGKGFQSWKALFGHMKCHSHKERERPSSSSSVTAHNNHNHSRSSNVVVHHSCSEDQDSWTVTDSQSDNEALKPRKRTRSKRARTTSSLSFSSVPEIEQEQQEVALCLMMLSRGSPEMRCDNKSKGLFEVFSPDRLQRTKFKKLDFKSVTEHSVEDVKGKRDFKFLGSDLSSQRGGKFECTTCNKIFHSYQALGGHRASHKRIPRGCFVPVIDESSENSIKPDLSLHETISASHLPSLDGNKVSLLADEASDESKKAETSRDLIEEPVDKIRELIDLNLPADDGEEEEEEEDSNNNSNSECYRSSPWWVRSIPNKQELLDHPCLIGTTYICS